MHLNTVSTGEEITEQLRTILEASDAEDTTVTTVIIPTEIKDLAKVCEGLKGLPDKRGTFNRRIDLNENVAYAPARKAYRVSQVEDTELRNRSRRGWSRAPSESPHCSSRRPCARPEEGPQRRRATHVLRLQSTGC